MSNDDARAAVAVETKPADARSVASADTGGSGDGATTTRKRRPILKLVIILFVAFVALVVAGFLGVYSASGSRMAQRFDIQPDVPAIPTDAAAIARGKHLAEAVMGCAARECHRENLAGGVFIDDPEMGHIEATNLTSGEGGIAGTYENIDWVRAIRHGLAPDGRPLLMMPSADYIAFGDAQIGDLIAYLKSVPPVDRTLRTRDVGLLARVLFLKGELPLLHAELIPHEAARTQVEPGPTKEYGQVLAGVCLGCHGETYSGGVIPGMPPETPPATNLTPHEATGIGAWSEEDFVTSMRTGKRPDGSEVDKVMPWMAFRNMTDEELHALWLFLQALPAKEEGNR